MSREEIISAIKRGNSTVLAKVYADHRKQFLVWFINRYGCSTDMAKELYHKVIITFYEAILEEKIVSLTTSLDTLLIGIGKNLYKSEQRKEERKAKVDDFYLADEDQLDEIYIEDQADYVLNRMQIEKVKDLLSEMGNECQNILELYYYQNLSIKQVGEILGIEDDNLVKSKKFRCISRLRELFKSTK